MKILVAALGGALAFASPAPALAQTTVPAEVAAQVQPGANLTALSASSGVPVQNLVAVARSKGLITASSSAAAGGGVAGAGAGGLAGLGLTGTLTAAIAAGAIFAIASDDDETPTTTATTTN